MISDFEGYRRNILSRVLIILLIFFIVYFVITYCFGFLTLKLIKYFIYYEYLKETSSSFAKSKYKLVLGIQHIIDNYLFYLSLGVSVFILLVQYIKIKFNPEKFFFKRLSLREPSKDDLYHKKVLNIVSELSIAAGIEKPKVWIIEETTRNALSFEGNLCVTEGLLSSFDRDELTAVIAHELGHIVVGDVTLKTVISGMMGAFTLGFGRFLDSLVPTTGPLSRGGYSSRGEELFIFLIPYYILSSFASFVFGIIKGVLISQFEFLADATAIELTRNPEALARALLRVEKEGFKLFTDPAILPCFFVPPDISNFSKRLSFFKLNSHIEERLEKLLGTARNIKPEFEKTYEKVEKGVAVSQKKETPRRGVYAYYHEKWVGPFDIKNLLSKTWVGMDTPLLLPNGKKVFARLFLIPLLQKSKGSSKLCPRCGFELRESRIEWTNVLRCFNCGGVLVKHDDIIKILTRDEVNFTKQEQELSEKIINEYRQKLKKVPIDGKLVLESPLIPPQILAIDPSKPLVCPVCKIPMERKIFSALYAIPIDACNRCGRIFFDGGEIDMLQALYKKYTKKKK